MAGVPSLWWGRGVSLTPAFLFSPRSSEGDGVCVRSVQPGAHQVTKTGPASSWALHGLTAGMVGTLAARGLGCLVPSMASTYQRTLVLSSVFLPAPGWGQTSQSSLPHSICRTAGTQLCPAPWHLLYAAVYLPGPCGLAQ